MIYGGIEVGSIGEQVSSHQRRYWALAIDTVLRSGSAGGLHGNEAEALP
jgi:hypothetical protein